MKTMTNNHIGSIIDDMIRLVLDLEGIPVEFIDNQDIVFVNNNLTWPTVDYSKTNCKAIILMDIYSAIENHLEIISVPLFKFCQRHNTKQIVYLTQFKNTIIPNAPDNLTVLDYDIMFNRTKAYYSQFPFKSTATHTGIPWYWAGHYQIASAPRRGEYRSRIFLHCSRLYPDRVARKHFFARELLAQHLKQYAELGYYSAVTPTETKADQGLYSFEHDPLVNGDMWFDVNSKTVVDLSANGTLTKPHAQAKGYSPPHLNYYEDTFISIYGESIEFGTSTIISEKTLDPLIHGHLILPYSNAGFVDTVRQQGFRLPDWIDYSYSNEPDDNVRYQLYTAEVDRLLSQSRAWWIEHFDSELDNRIHNQQLFWTRPYYRFSETLVQKGCSITPTQVQ
jgi:hypothetical protein